MLAPPPTPQLFPYTTLFRSDPPEHLRVQWRFFRHREKTRGGKNLLAKLRPTRLPLLQGLVLRHGEVGDIGRAHVCTPVTDLNRMPPRGCRQYEEHRYHCCAP